jgi:anti-anti-sigma factor
MENFYLAIRGDVLTIEVNLLKATVNEAAEIRDLLEGQLVFGHSKIVVDLSQCTHLDSTFIGVLVVTKKLLTDGGELKIVDPLDPAKEMFYLTGINKIFDTFEIAEDAVKSFNNRIKPLEPKSDDVIPKKNVAWAFA